MDPLSQELTVDLSSFIDAERLTLPLELLTYVNHLIPHCSADDSTLAITQSIMKMALDELRRLHGPAQAEA